MPADALAHSVGFGREMTATLHFPPDDRPIAGRETLIELIELKNQSSGFKPKDCDCRLTISLDGHILKQITLSAEGTDIAGRYTFPSRGNYHLRFNGTPANDSSFTPFEINYVERIDLAASSSANKNYGLLLLVSIAATLILAVGLTIKFLRPDTPAAS